MMSGSSEALSKGFTVVELIVVIFLLGVLSAVAVSRMVKPSAFAPASVSAAASGGLRAAQALAADRRSTTIDFLLERAGAEYRMTVQTADGTVLSRELIAAANTRIAVTAGGASGTLDAGNPLQVQYRGTGDLAAASLGALVLPAATAIEIAVQGDSVWTLCLYPSGYVSDADCL